jgi:peptidoglycan hydrolase CwlO-like protein
MTPKAPETAKVVPPMANTSVSGDDPLAAAKTLKSQIQSYVQRHKDNIQKYQNEIKETENKIQAEKDALRKKQEEFSALVREMGELTSCFNGNEENASAPKGGKGGKK